jgi:pyochelin biosynthetic protein PchC
VTAVRVPRPVPRPARRLLCFPWAGAAASVYRSWAAALPPGVELVAAQYPGREDRSREPFATDLEALADEVVEALIDHLADAGEALEDTPLTLFGHSAGASVALATARLLERDAPGAVRGLVVSGRRATPPARSGRSPSWTPPPGTTRCWPRCAPRCRPPAPTPPPAPPPCPS